MSSLPRDPKPALDDTSKAAFVPLRNKGYDKKVIEKLKELISENKKIEGNLNKTQS